MSAIDELLRLLKAGDQIAADVVKAIEPVLTSPAFDDALTDTIRNADLSDIDNAIKEMQEAAGKADGLTRQAQEFLTGDAFKITLTKQINETKFTDDILIKINAGDSVTYDDISLIADKYSDIPPGMLLKATEEVAEREASIRALAAELMSKNGLESDAAHDAARSVWVQKKAGDNASNADASPATPSSKDSPPADEANSNSARTSADDGSYKAPETVLPEAYRNFMQQLTRLHYSNWGTGIGFVNKHTRFIPGVQPIGNLTKNIPNIFTGRDFIRPLVKDIDTTIQNSGVIDAVKGLDAQLQDIATQVGNNKLSIADAKEQVRQAFDGFADSNKSGLNNLAENTEVRLKELEATDAPDKKYHGTERLSENQLIVTKKYVNDINGMATTMSKTGGDNEILMDFLGKLDDAGNDRGAFEVALSAGSTDRMSRIGSSPEIRLAGWKGIDGDISSRPSLATERELERSLSMSMYQRTTRFTAKSGANNAELTMGRLATMFKGKSMDEAGRIDWGQEDYKTLMGYARSLYTAGSPHEAARAIKIAHMHTGVKASDTLPNSFFDGLIETKSGADQNYREFIDDLQRTFIDEKDAPFKFGPRDTEKLLSDPYEYFTYGWAFPLPEKGNTRLFDLPQSGIPGQYNRTQYVANLQTKAKSYLLGGSTEVVPGTKPGELDELRTIYPEGKGANPIRGLGNVARDGIWKPTKFLATGGLSNAHIRWGTVAAVDAGILLVGGAKGVEWASEQFGFGENGEGWDTGLEWSLPIDAATYTTRLGINALTWGLTKPIDAVLGDDNKVGEWIRENANIPEGDTILSGVNYFAGEETVTKPSSAAAAPNVVPTTLIDLQNKSDDKVDAAKSTYSSIETTLGNLTQHLNASKTSVLQSIQNVIDNSTPESDRFEKYTDLKSAVEERFDAYITKVKTNGDTLLPSAKTAYDGVVSQGVIISDKNTLMPLANIAWGEQEGHVSDLGKISTDVAGADKRIRAELDAIMTAINTNGILPAIILTAAEQAAMDKVDADARAAEALRIAEDARIAAAAAAIAAAAELNTARDANTAAQAALQANPEDPALQAAAAKTQTEYDKLNTVEIARLKAVEDARIATAAKAQADADAAEAARVASLSPEEKTAEAAKVEKAARAKDPLYDEHKDAGSALAEATRDSGRIAKLYGTDEAKNSAAFLVAGMQTQQIDKVKALSEEMFDKGDHTAVGRINELLADMNGNTRAAEEHLAQLAHKKDEANTLQREVTDLNAQIQGMTALSGKDSAKDLLETLQGKTDAIEVIKTDSEALHKQISTLVSDNAALLQQNPDTKHHFGTGGTFEKGAIAAGGGEYGLLNQFMGSKNGGDSVIGGYFNMAASKLRDGKDWWSEVKRGAKTQGEMNGYNLAEQGFLAFMSIVALNKVGEWTGMSKGVKIAALVGIIGYFINRSGATGQDMRDHADAKNPFAQVNPSLRGRNNIPTAVSGGFNGSIALSSNGNDEKDNVVTLTGKNGEPIQHELNPSGKQEITAQSKDGEVPTNIVDLDTARVAKEQADRALAAGQGSSKNIPDFVNRADRVKIVPNGEIGAQDENIVPLADNDNVTPDISVKAAGQ